MDTNTQNMACHGKITSICNKQHLSNIWGSIHEKFSQRWGWVEKSVAYKEKHVMLKILIFGINISDLCILNVDGKNTPSTWS